MPTTFRWVLPMKGAFESRHHAPDYSFSILHGGRQAERMDAEFRMWQLSYSAATASTLANWTDTELEIETDHSSLIVALGSGGPAVETQKDALKIDPQGRTSRAVFWAFCDALKSKIDPLSGGAPQVVGLYRKGTPESFGVSYQGQRYFQGLSLPNGVRTDGVRWRDENFQHVDGTTLELLPGAQRHSRSPKP
jgi:hypothetical protein